MYSWVIEEPASGLPGELSQRLRVYIFSEFSERAKHSWIFKKIPDGRILIVHEYMMHLFCLECIWDRDALGYSTATPPERRRMEGGKEAFDSSAMRFSFCGTHLLINSWISE